MILINKKKFKLYSYEKEIEIEEDILKVSSEIFGQDRIYIDLKKKIGKKGKVNNIPDGYLLDFSSKKEPKLYVVENELAKHDPLKHIAVQILEFSLSFETSEYKVKSFLREAIQSNKEILNKVEKYIFDYSFENIDILLEKMIYERTSFNALVIIDEVSEELEKALVSRFQFPVEILTLQRFVSDDNEVAYSFEPFLSDVISSDSSNKNKIDLSEIDTIVVPARKEGFEEVFIKENRWYSIRIHSSMIPKIKYIAVYQVSPHSAITHIAEVLSITRWQDTNKYVVNFKDKAKAITPIKLVKNGTASVPQSPRYTSMLRLEAAQNLDDVF